MPAQRLQALPRLDVPNFARPVDRPADAELAAKIELRARNLPVVPAQRVDAGARADVPQLDGVVEGPRDHLATVRVEI